MKLLCWIFGHDWLFRVKTLSPISYLVLTQKICRRCGKMGLWYIGVDLGGMSLPVEQWIIDGQRVVKGMEIYEFSVVSKSEEEE